MFPWLSFFNGLLKVAALVGEIVRDKQLMDAGAARESAKQLSAVAQRTGITDQVRAEIAGMTDDALDDELRGP